MLSVIIIAIASSVPEIDGDATTVGIINTV
jgi:hypothetical protein